VKGSSFDVMFEVIDILFWQLEEGIQAIIYPSKDISSCPLQPPALQPKPGNMNV
jgi:hypothetical protein